MTLFTFGRKIRWECGAWEDMAVGQQQTSEGIVRPNVLQSGKERREAEAEMLAAIKDSQHRLEKLGERANGIGDYEDRIYRFHQQRMEVFFLQNKTVEI